MRYLNYIMLVTCLLLGLCSCSEDDLDQKSVFGGTPQLYSDFDAWLQENYTNPYNIDFKYRMEDKESDQDYNLIPAKLENSIAMAKLVKFLWLDVYMEVMDNNRNFICTYGPKMIHLIGSPAYEEGQIVLGTAEGGLKVTLYNIDMLDPRNPDVEMMNYWYFKTMHHEFSHILHQTIEFPKEFYDVSTGKYTGAGWVNITDQEALEKGFITNYGSTEVHEDFAELVANYITHTEKWWDDQLALAGESGAKIITRKMDMVIGYMKDVWGIDMNRLREIVQRRSSQVKYLDLTTLDN